jgi:hypothetical protein
MCTKKKKITVTRRKKRRRFLTKNKQTNKQAEKKGVAKINEKQLMILKDSNCDFFFVNKYDVLAPISSKSVSDSQQNMKFV